MLTPGFMRGRCRGGSEGRYRGLHALGVGPLKRQCSIALNRAIVYGQLLLPALRLVPRLAPLSCLHQTLSFQAIFVP